MQKSQFLTNNNTKIKILNDLTLQNFKEQKWDDWVDNINKSEQSEDELNYTSLDAIDIDSSKNIEENIEENITEEPEVDAKILRWQKRCERKNLKQFMPDTNKKIFGLYKKILRLYLDLHLEKYYTNKVNKKKNKELFRFHLEKINSTEDLKEDLKEDNKALGLYKKILNVMLNKLRLKRMVYIKKDKKVEYEVRDPTEPKKVAYFYKKIFRIQLKRLKPFIDKKINSSLQSPELKVDNLEVNNVMVQNPESKVDNLETDINLQIFYPNLKSLEDKDVDKYKAILNRRCAARWRYRQKKLNQGEKIYNDYDKLRKFRNFETMFRSLRRQEIKKWVLPIEEDKQNLQFIDKKSNVKKKFVSFLKYSLLSPQNTEKFSVLYSNVYLKTFKGGKYKGGFRFFRTVSITPSHKKCIRIILRGFVLILFAFLSQFSIYLLNKLEDDQVDDLNYKHSLNIENFYFFFHKYFNDFFLYSKILKRFQLSFTMDKYQKLYWVDLYNINCLVEWNPFYIQLNFQELLTAEGDSIRPKAKVLGYKSKFKKKLILYWLTNPDMRPCWNFDYYNLDFKNYTGPFFDIYCIFEYLSEEFQYNFYSFNSTLSYNYMFNSFKSDFFNKYNLYKSNFVNPKRLLYKLYKSKNRLLTIFYLKKGFFYSLINKAKSIIKRQKKRRGSFFIFLKKSIYKIKTYAIKYLLSIQKKIFNIQMKIKNSFYTYSFHSFNYIIPLHKFTIILPYTFFLIYTFYSLYYRRIKYTFYIRNHPWLHEYTSVKQYFTLANHAKGGDNRNKIFYWKFWKLWCFNMFLMSKKEFTKKFNLFSLIYTKRDYYIEYDNTLINYTFNIFDRVSEFDLYCDLNDHELFSEIKNIVNYFMEIPYLSHLSMVMDKWKFFMRLKNVYKFFFANIDIGPHLNYFLSIMYSVPSDRAMYWNNWNFKIIYLDFIKIYYENFNTFFFLRDLLTYFNNKVDERFFKLNNFYYNIIDSSIYGSNPKKFLDLYFYDRSFYDWSPSKNYSFNLSFEMLFYIFFFIIDHIKLWSINIHHFILQLQWHWNISTYYDMYYNYNYYIINNIVELIKQNRLKSIWLQMCFFLREKNINISSLYKNFLYYDSLKDFYFILLARNIEYILLCFFLDLKNSYLLYNNYNNFLFKDLQFYWNTILSYRYAAYNNVCTFDYYENWYSKSFKFDLWIYYKDYKHEGSNCYRKNLNEIF